MRGRPSSLKASRCGLVVEDEAAPPIVTRASDGRAPVEIDG
jgi:hypothetical protein